MSPDLQMSVLCDDVRQERSGKFILIGLFDVIGMPQYPALFPRICIVNRWCCGEGRHLETCRRCEALCPKARGSFLWSRPTPMATA